MELQQILTNVIPKVLRTGFPLLNGDDGGGGGSDCKNPMGTTIYSQRCTKLLISDESRTTMLSELFKTYPDDEGLALFLTGPATAIYDLSL